MTLAQAVGGCIRCADLTVPEIGNAAQKEPEPQTALHRITRQNTGMVLMSQPSPRNLFDLVSRGYTKETVILIGDAHIPGVILGDTMHRSAGNSAYGDKAVV